jgi:hypothetical protein
MKKISEKEILNIISEEVEMGLAEYRLKKKIKGMVKEAFESMPSSYDFEETENNKDSESKNTKRKRDAIENLFKKNLAPPMSKEAYNLYNIDIEKGKDSTEMKNARSLFAKKAENAMGDNGHQYEFTPEEVNKIYNDLSSSHLTEAQLTKIVAESVKSALKEIGDTPQGRYALAAVQGRAMARKQAARQAGNDAEYNKQQQVFDDADDAMASGQKQGYKKANKQLYGGDMAQADAQGFKYGFKKGQK